VKNVSWLWANKGPETNGHDKNHLQGLSQGSEKRSYVDTHTPGRCKKGKREEMKADRCTGMTLSSIKTKTGIQKKMGFETLKKDQSTESSTIGGNYSN